MKIIEKDGKEYLEADCVFPDYRLLCNSEGNEAIFDYETYVRKKHDDGLYYLIPLRMQDRIMIYDKLYRLPIESNVFLKKCINETYCYLLFHIIDPALTVIRKPYDKPRPAIFIDINQEDELKRIRPHEKINIS